MMRSVNNPERFVGATPNAVARLTLETDAPSLDPLRWRAVPGLFKGRGISLESMAYPGHYLRHRDSRLLLEPFVDDDFYRQDATFHDEPPGTVDSRFTLRSDNAPAHFIRHYLGQIEISSAESRPGTPFEEDRAFVWDFVRRGLSG